MKVISLLICHKLIFIVNMPDKIVTLNDILVGKMYDIYFLFRKTKTIKLNRKLNFLGVKQQQFKAVLHLLFLCLNPFSSLTQMQI